MSLDYVRTLKPPLESYALLKGFRKQGDILTVQNCQNDVVHGLSLTSVHCYDEIEIERKVLVDVYFGLSKSVSSQNGHFFERFPTNPDDRQDDEIIFRFVTRGAAHIQAELFQSSKLFA